MEQFVKAICILTVYFLCISTEKSNGYPFEKQAEEMTKSPISAREIAQVERRITSNGELQETRGLFNTFDENGDGYFTFDEAKIVIEKRDEGPLSQEDFESLRSDILVADTDGNGKVDFEEFEIFVQIVAAFEKIDTNSDQSVSRKELRLLLERKTGQPASAEQINELFEESDSNKDGKISFPEFAKVTKQ